MEDCCNLEVDVNGEETFLVDKKTICLYSGRLRKMFGKSSPDITRRNLKVIFQKFPGGPESFELVSRFCYSHGRTKISPHNITVLHTAAHFMDMTGSVSGTNNLVEQTQRFLNDLRHYWSWPGLLAALKHCQELDVPEKCLDSLMARITLAIEPSSTPSVSSYNDRISCDTKSTESLRTGFLRGSTWWFEDLLFLKPDLLEPAIRSIVSKKFDHIIIGKFLFYYQKSKFLTVATPREKLKIVETIIDLLYGLEHSLIPCKGLFGVLGVSLGMKISKCRRTKLEIMIGSHMDRATLDNLLLPSPCGANYLYDVDLVLRFMKAFLQRRNCSAANRLKSVACLMDTYVAEVAPDPCLKPSKFLELVMALPDSARDSSDEVYHAITMYLEVHAGLVSEEEEMMLCSAVDYKKLSPEARKDLSQMMKERKQIVPYGGELDHDNEKLMIHLQGMKCRVMELENVCRKMQIQMAKITKSKGSNCRNSRSMPKFC